MVMMRTKFPKGKVTNQTIGNIGLFTFVIIWLSFLFEAVRKALTAREIYFIIIALLLQVLL